MNNYSKMFLIYIYNKNKTKQQLKTYKNNMKKQFEKIFQHICNNNVKKYLMMKTSLKQQQIHFEIIITYTFKQNEIIRKLNRILVTTAKKMLL